MTTHASSRPAESAATTPAEPWTPALAPGVLLRRDPVRGADLLVLPEKVVVLTGRAARVLRLCDGRRTVPAVVAELAAAFPGAPVAGDVPPFLAGLREKGWLR
ncbi:pyrroloquinoline quinone biosynthesis peptide chaperone PqqD [Streptomyces sp. NPDC051940]|uniref:pyrroloquinoline quinone biosynthesis peptide chaperone PqqD n=1 Tax=Streptomyces sp. NPDC051940 TaxID=3155675 RepID=UPI0034313CDD